jgi:hypothetical protein
VYVSQLSQHQPTLRFSQMRQSAEKHPLALSGNQHSSSINFSTKHDNALSARLSQPVYHSGFVALNVHMMIKTMTV